MVNGNPRSAFILWMAVNGKLLTQDKMAKWSMGVLLCPLCSKCPDSHDHLFFKCEFSKIIWNHMKPKLNTGSIPSDWNDIVLTIENLPCTNAIRSILRR